MFIGRRMIVVYYYNYLALEQQIREYCQNCTGNTWEEVACKLTRMGKWEFEDYIP
ncbi:MAG: Imm8 family immunity protein [Adhaeribacter sp.]